MDLPPRLRFKLERWKAALRSSTGPKSSVPSSGHRMCPNCRALIDRNSTVCPLCGAPVGKPRARGSTTPGRVLGIIPIPGTATAVIAAVCILLYAVSWYLTQTGGFSGSSGGGIFGGIAAQVLLRLGGKFGPLMYAGQWWRLVTAMFLHAGILHIGLNLWVLFDIGPEVESLFATSKFIVLYLVTGVAGYLLSLWWSPFALSIGASGAILGLVGILIGASFHHGHLGKEYRGQLWRWVIYIFIFGLFFSIDNAAHLGGLITGFVLGYFIPEGEPETRSSENIWNTLAVFSVLIIAGSFALMALQINQPFR